MKLSWSLPAWLVRAPGRGSRGHASSAPVAGPEGQAASAAPATSGLSGALAPLQARARQLLTAFNQRQERERLLLIATASVVALALADRVWITPALTQYNAAQDSLQQAIAAQRKLQTEAQQLATLATTQQQQRRAELTAWRQRAREGEAVLRSHEDTLVGPEQMMSLLERMLARHGQVRVKAMRSLDRTDLLAETPAAGAAAAKAASPAATASSTNAPSARGQAAAAAATAPSLYRHGVELTLEGGYADLLAYLQALENQPQHVLWGGMSLKVQTHPTSVITLRLYTISRERHWLEI